MPSQRADSAPSGSRVGLLVTCLVDLHRPTVGFAAIRLLEEAGFEVVVPDAQTCCGQPAFNSGDMRSSEAIAKQVIEAFEGLPHVVVPSGSCAGMLAAHYPELFEDEPDWRARAESLAARTVELMSFLQANGGLQRPTRFAGRVTYHDSCSGLRELGIKEQPRALLAEVEGLDLVEMDDTDVCCGFGGAFCVKFPDISERMVSDKVALAKATGADTLLGGDLGCLMNIAGRLHRLGEPMRVRHAAEVLAGLGGEPAIGAPESERRSEVTS